MTAWFSSARPQASIAPSTPEPEDIVAKCLHRAGLEPNTLRLHFTPLCAKLIDLLLRGGTTRQVGRICGMNHTSIMPALRKEGAEPEWVPGQPHNEVMACIFLSPHTRPSLDDFPGKERALGIGEPDNRVKLVVPQEVIERAKYGGGEFWRVEALADREKRDKIEDSAVNTVKEYYCKQRYDVSSVEPENKGWDLECLKNGKVALRVEVKGTESPDIRVQLTPNEYGKSCSANYQDSYRLAVVRNALSPKPKCAIYEKDGENWRRPAEEGGNDKDAPDSLVTERVDAAVIRERRDSDE